jgi:protoporphyrinogen oxidase
VLSAAEHTEVTHSTLIIGAGPAGLTAAYELVKAGRSVCVVEQDPRRVGGISRTEEYKGFRFDIGGHRFFSKNPEIEQLWTEILGDRMRVRGRLSRIYYGGHFYKYPLEPLDALRKLGPREALACALSYARTQGFRQRPIRSFEDWVVQAFGRRLYEIFFKTYTEKVWGIPCGEISADWAAQRIKGLSIPSLIRSALRPNRSGNGAVIKTLIDRFRYPPHGPGEMWQTTAARVRERGGTIRMGERAMRIRREPFHVVEVTTLGDDGEHTHRAEHFISTMPIRQLMEAMDPPPPPKVLEAARALRYRDFFTVVLVVDQAEVFPDNWIYVHDPTVRMGRIQNFKNWSPEMVPDPRYTALGLEYFCSEGDDLWDAPNAELIAMGTREIRTIGLVDAAIVDGTVVRQPKAYPVYDHGYQHNVALVRDFLRAEAPNLQLVGRNGMHKYNNQDHAMMTGLMAARNILGASFDVWRVNSDAEYLEEEEFAADASRQVPARIGRAAEVWGIPALDVISPESGYLGVAGLPLLADMFTFFLLHHYGGVWFVLAFVIGCLVGSAVYRIREAIHRGGLQSLRSWNPLLIVLTDAANCCLVNLGLMLIYVQYFEGSGSVARICTAATLTLLALVRQNLLAARQRLLIGAAEENLTR